MYTTREHASAVWGKESEKGIENSKFARKTKKLPFAGDLRRLHSTRVLRSHKKHIFTSTLVYQ